MNMRKYRNIVSLMNLAKVIIVNVSFLIILIILFINYTEGFTDIEHKINSIYRKMKTSVNNMFNDVDSSGNTVDSSGNNVTK